MPIIESGDPTEGQAHNMVETPAHDIDCGPPAPPTLLYAVQIVMGMSNHDPYWIARFNPSDPSTWPNPPLIIWDHGCDSFIGISGAAVFNPHNLNTSGGPDITQSQPSAPTDYGLNEPGNCFLVAGGAYPLTNGADNSQWLGTVSDGYTQPWGTLIANAVVNPLYIGPAVPWSDVPWPGPYALYGRSNSGASGQGLGFHSGDPATYIHSSQPVQAGTYLATIRAGFYWTGQNTLSNPTEFPAAASMTGTISVGFQEICKVNTDGVPVLFGATEFSHDDLVTGQRYSGQFTVVIPRSGPLRMDVQTLNGQDGDIFFSLQFQHS